MASKEIELADVIGRFKKYQTISTLVAMYNEAILGTYAFYLQFLFVEVTMYWNWDTASENRTTFSSANCRMEDVLSLNYSSNISNEHSVIVYESKYMKTSLTEKFGFVCERTWLISLSKSVIIVGSLIGSLIIGRLCEKFGRRLTIVGLQVVLLICHFCILFARFYPLFAVACGVSGICVFPAYIVSVVQVTELLPISWRPWYGTVIRYGVIIGQVSITGLSWILMDWFNLQIVFTVLVAISIPLIWYVLDSPAWLIVRGREEDAKRHVMIIARRNGKNAEESEQKADAWIAAMKEKQGNKQTGEKGIFKNLFISRIIAKYTICATLSVSFPFFVFFSTIMTVEAFGSGLYQDVMVISGLSVAGLIVSAVFLKMFSIRKLQIFCLLLCAIDSLIYVFTYEYDIARTITGCLLRALLIPVTCTNLVYMAELFPTSVRIVGSGFVMTFTTLLQLGSPFTKDLGEKTYVYVPFILYAAMMFLSACFMMLLPETKTRPLIQTVEELTKRKDQKREGICTIQTRL